MLKQQQKRQEIAQLLYLYEFNNNLKKEREVSYNNHLLNSEEISLVLDEYNKIIAKKEVIDKIIADNIENYSLSSLNIMDLSIIRLAVYELKFSDIPYNIIINEALELTKKFTNLDDDTQKKFTNKLLDSIYKSISSLK